MENATSSTQLMTESIHIIYLYLNVFSFEFLANFLLRLQFYCEFNLNSIFSFKALLEKFEKL